MIFIFSQKGIFRYFVYVFYLNFKFNQFYWRVKCMIDHNRKDTDSIGSGYWKDISLNKKDLANKMGPIFSIIFCYIPFMVITFDTHWYVKTNFFCSHIVMRNYCLFVHLENNMDITYFSERLKLTLYRV